MNDYRASAVNNEVKFGSSNMLLEDLD